MSEDITNLRLSKHASDIANQMKESEEFDDALSAAKFGMAYAIKYYKDNLKTINDLDCLDGVYDASGNNYNVGSIDPDNYIARFLELLYPGNRTPYRYARILMCYGLNKLGDLLDENKLFPISKNM